MILLQLMSKYEQVWTLWLKIIPLVIICLPPKNVVLLQSKIIDGYFVTYDVVYIQRLFINGKTLPYRLMAHVKSPSVYNYTFNRVKPCGLNLIGSTWVTMTNFGVIVKFCHRFKYCNGHCLVALWPAIWNKDIERFNSTANYSQIKLI